MLVNDWDHRRGTQTINPWESSGVSDQVLLGIKTTSASLLKDWGPCELPPGIWRSSLDVEFGSSEVCRRLGGEGRTASEPTDMPMPFLSFPITYSFFFFFSRATPMAHGGSQARGLIGAVAAGLCHNHSNAESEPCL